ncbi:MULTISPECIES: 2-oxo acid dehydrogenase subunit E2 [Nocardia]|uniref:2-oxo acid dehydrogenase subunit E2 n=1 Tax=Nocardia TaxID=1817 RepID=UPI000D69C65C|nr:MULTISPECIES: 2-oxo acid dehydrogenase subunit E2 [Nocardia]
MIEFRMPSLGADMTEGTLLRWLVVPGEAVHAGQVVAEVDTTKAAIEIECFDDGILTDVLVPEGATVPVGAVLATIRPPGPDDTPPATTDSTARKSTGEAAASNRADSEVQAVTLPSKQRAADRAPVPDVHATPLVQRLAEEAGLDLGSMTGSGPGGRVLRVDVERAVARRRGGDRERVPASGYARRLATDFGVDLLGVGGTGPDGAVQAGDVMAARSESAATPARAVGAGPASPAASAEQPAPQRDRDEIRRIIAAAMTRSKQTVPHYYLSSPIDMDAALRWLHDANLDAPVSARILPAALLLRAVAGAARTVPELNGHWIDDAFRPADSVHVGVVVSLRGGGIIVPTIPHADTLSVAQTMERLRALVDRARDARLRSADTTPATITVTNLGDLGAETVFGVIAVPQVAIIGFGAIEPRPCAVDGLLGVRPQLTATLSGDHRASDGVTGSRFLRAVSDLLQHPEEL